MNPAIRIMLADSNHFFRDGLRLHINTISDFEIVAEVSTAVDAVNFAQRYQPDVILMELNFPPSDGFTATKQILAENPKCNIAILTSSQNKTDIYNALLAGATSYLLKGTTPEELHRSIRLMATGNAIFDSHITHTITEFFTKANTCYPAHHFPELTHRENEVFTFVAQGWKNKQIAIKCNITEKTVRNHITNILSKLGASSRGEAISRLQQSCPTITA